MQTHLLSWNYFVFPFSFLQSLFNFHWETKRWNCRVNFSVCSQRFCVLQTHSGSEFSPLASWLNINTIQSSNEDTSNFCPVIIRRTCMSSFYFLLKLLFGIKPNPIFQSFLSFLFSVIQLALPTQEFLWLKTDVESHSTKQCKGLNNVSRALFEKSQKIPQLCPQYFSSRLLQQHFRW